MTKQRWMDAWDTCRPEEIGFPPGSTLSHRRLFPGFCELIRKKEGEEGDAACLTRYLQQSTVTNAPSW